MEIPSISPTIMAAYLIMYMLMNRQQQIHFDLPEKVHDTRLPEKTFRRQFGYSNQFVARNKPNRRGKIY
jgi:hypothetical protein